MEIYFSKTNWYIWELILLYISFGLVYSFAKKKFAVLPPNLVINNEIFLCIYGIVYTMIIIAIIMLLSKFVLGKFVLYNFVMGKQKNKA